MKKFEENYYSTSTRDELENSPENKPVETGKNPKELSELVEELRGRVEELEEIVHRIHNIPSIKYKARYGEGLRH